MHAIQIIRDLARLSGAHIAVRPISQSESFGARIPEDIRARFVSGVQPEEWELLLHPPNFLPTPGKKTAFFTMWETTKLPAYAVPLLNQAQVVIVPSEWNASCFSACGVTAPIRVVPLGINPEVFRFIPRSDPRQNSPVTGKPARCVFGAAGRMAHGGVRKGINEVIELFQQAFPKEKDVLLRVKCFPDCDVKKVKDKRVQITQAYLSEEEMAQWFASLDAFVSCARGEGWGLMQHQAMAIGRALVSVHFGGVSEFFHGPGGFVLRHKLMPAQGAYENCGHWAEPWSSEVIQAFRWAYHDPSFINSIGGLVEPRLLTWENSNMHLLAVLKEFGAL